MLRFFDGPHQRAVVEGRQHQAADALRDEAFDNLYLLLAVVFAQRPFPDHLDFSSLRRQLARRFDRAGMNALPEFVCRAFGDNGDGQLLPCPIMRTVLAAARTKQRRRCDEYHSESFQHSFPYNKGAAYFRQMPPSTGITTPLT